MASNVDQIRNLSYSQPIRRLATAILLVAALSAAVLVMVFYSLHLGSWPWCVVGVLTVAASLMRLLPERFSIKGAKLFLTGKQGRDRLERSIAKISAETNVPDKTVEDIFSGVSVTQPPGLGAAINTEANHLRLGLIQLDLWFATLLLAVLFCALVIHAQTFARGLGQTLPPAQTPNALTMGATDPAKAIAVVPIKPGGYETNNNGDAVIRPKPGSSLADNVDDGVKDKIGAIKDKLDQALKDGETYKHDLDAGTDVAALTKQKEQLTETFTQIIADADALAKAAAANKNEEAKKQFEEIKSEATNAKDAISKTNPGNPPGNRKPPNYDSDWDKIKKKLEDLLKFLREAWELIQKYMDFFKKVSNSQSSNGQSSNGQSSNGQSSNNQSSNGQSSNGQSPNNQSSNGQPSNNASNSSQANGTNGGTNGTFPSKISVTITKGSPVGSVRNTTDSDDGRYTNPGTLSNDVRNGGSARQGSNPDNQ